ncbi:MAG: hypothetical protein A2286_02015 [Gammaproteobacteria bacterium RIFOXYA12_FULL_61_12]|nr:MAG: hypothetical protein A2514_13455 [Gammaproteobacteria bacterium RIFOXYD12_FULL_61_37]OGT93426.1 MAG: hypothetical protein A2286_02015 [Gammaproteobacteria bacterium RIFOXYA12_FULL_61_12]
MKRGSIFLLLVLSLSQAQAAVWENRNRWNDDWEGRFGQWLGKGFTPDIFVKGKYGGIAQDCADAVYFARLIFAYENGLPFVIQGANGLIDNEMGDFDDQPPKRRLRRFFDYVGQQVSTNTLMRDTYPVQLDRKWFRPGVVAALPHIHGPNETAGHGQIVTQVERNGVVHYLKSTVPAKVQPLLHTTLNSFVPAPKAGSFRYWKQPKDYGKSESALPGYGTEQYHLKGIFEDEMQKRIALVEEGRDEKLSRLAGEVCHQVAERVPMVEEAWQFKQKIGRRCMSYKEFDDYSTPSRDGKIKKALVYMAVTATGNSEGDVGQLAKYLDKACGGIEYLPGKRITAAKFSERIMAGKVSSDPNQPPGVRWGDQDEERLGCKQFY